MKEYFQELEHAHKDMVFKFYEILASQSPNLIPSIKWNAPNFAKNGIDCVTFRLFPKDIFQIILHRGAKVKDASGFAFDDQHNICKWAATDRAIIDVLKHSYKEDEIFETVRNWVKII